MLAIIAIIVLALLAIWLLSGVVNSVIGIVVALVIWAITGWLVGKLVDRDGKSFNTLTCIALGLGGGIVGSLVFRLLGLQGIGDIWLVGAIIVGVIGGLIIVGLARLFTGGRAFR